MPVQFIGYIGFNNNSEIHQLSRGRELDRDYVETAAAAQEEGGFDRVLIPFGSNSPESQIVAAHAAAITSKLGFLIAHRPGFTQPTLAARQLATLDQLSGGRVAVHIITGGSDDELARDGDHLTKDERYRRTDEYLTILRREWTAEQPFDHEGRFYKIHQAISSIKPTNLPVFFGGSSDIAIEISGKHADVYALWGETQAQVRETVARVRAVAAKHGRPAPASASHCARSSPIPKKPRGSAPMRLSSACAICANRRAPAPAAMRRSTPDRSACSIPQRRAIV